MDILYLFLHNPTLKLVPVTNTGVEAKAKGLSGNPTIHPLYLTIHSLPFFSLGAAI